MLNEQVGSNDHTQHRRSVYQRQFQAPISVSRRTSWWVNNTAYLPFKIIWLKRCPSNSCPKSAQNSAAVHVNAPVTSLHPLDCAFSSSITSLASSLERIHFATSEDVALLADNFRSSVSCCYFEPWNQFCQSCWFCHYSLIALQTRLLCRSRGTDSTENYALNKISPNYSASVQCHCLNTNTIPSYSQNA